MLQTTRPAPRRPRTDLDRSVDEAYGRRRRRAAFRRRIRVSVSEADVAIYAFGLLSLMYCAITIVVEIARML